MTRPDEVSVYRPAVRCNNHGGGCPVRPHALSVYWRGSPERHGRAGKRSELGQSGGSAWTSTGACRTGSTICNIISSGKSLLIITATLDSTSSGKTESGVPSGTKEGGRCTRWRTRAARGQARPLPFMIALRSDGRDSAGLCRVVLTPESGVDRGPEIANWSAVWPPGTASRFCHHLRYAYLRAESYGTVSCRTKQP